MKDVLIYKDFMGSVHYSPEDEIIKVLVSLTTE